MIELESVTDGENGYIHVMWSDTQDGCKLYRAATFTCKEAFDKWHFAEFCRATDELEMAHSWRRSAEDAVNYYGDPED